MFTKKQYIEYLISTPMNYTCTHLANHLDGISHDVITDYLRREKQTAREVWKLAEGLIENRPEGYLIVDDSVQEKRHAQAIELVKRQYRGHLTERKKLYDFPFYLLLNRKQSNVL